MQFVKIPNKIINTNMSAGAIRLYSYIQAHCIASNSCYIGGDYIISNLPIKRKDTVANYIKQFDNNYIKAKRRYNKSNYYWCKPVNNDYTIVDLDIIISDSISNNDFLLYFVLASIYNNEGVRQAKKAQIRDMADISKHTYSKSINNLIDLNLLDIEATKDKIVYKIYHYNGNLHTGNGPCKNPVNVQKTVIPTVQKTGIQYWQPCNFPKQPCNFSVKPCNFPESNYTYVIRLIKYTMTGRRHNIKKSVDNITYRTTEEEEEKRKEEEKEEELRHGGRKAKPHNSQASDGGGASRAKNRNTNFNRAAIRNNYNGILRGSNFAKLMAKYDNLIDSQKQQVDKYVAHELLLFDFEAFNKATLDSRRKAFVAEYLCKDHPIANRYRAMSEAERKAERKKSKAYNDKLEYGRLAKQGNTNILNDTGREDMQDYYIAVYDKYGDQEQDQQEQITGKSLLEQWRQSA